MKEDVLDCGKYNIGWAILKLWMCYEVVLVHFWKLALYPKRVPPFGTGFIADMRAYAVPAFMLMTFALAAKKFAANDGAWLKKRFVRLLLPYIFWPVLTFAVWRMLEPVSEAFSAPLEYLGWQLLLGTTRQLGSQMWFQAVLIILTALFAVFFRFVKPKRIGLGLTLLFIGAVMAEYSGLNRWMLEGLRYEVCHPLGRVISMIPYAVVGLSFGLSRERFVGWSVGPRIVVVAVAIAIGSFLGFYEVFVVPPGFYYRGLKMLFIGMALATVFWFLPLDFLAFPVKKGIVWCSRYSMGVYFTHIFVGRLMDELVFPHIGPLAGSFKAANIVFLVSFVFCVALSRIPNRHVRALVT